jgi:hypothetical protein
LEKKSVIYLAGKMRGLPNHNRLMFAKAAAGLRAAGWSVYNPAAANFRDTDSLAFIMGKNIAQLCECDSIALLPGWMRSQGAWIEYQLAKYLGLTMYFLDDDLGEFPRNERTAKATDVWGV